MVKRHHVLHHTSYTIFPESTGDRHLAQYFTLPDLALVDAELMAELAGHALDHRFDLLGSGWIQIHHGMVCCGVEGFVYDAGPKVCADPAGHWLDGRISIANLRPAQEIWRQIEPGYVPIDWQLDFKSGFRWREDTWHQDIRFGHLPGIDIKSPWELARMHHLPQLALAYAFATRGTSGFKPASCYLSEFRNQILDFIATNPPGFGVNWVCAMDVGIRIANWLVAFDLFRSAGAVVEPAFEQLLLNSVYQHGRHIAANLEWIDGVRGNHYLANLAGLLFAAACLPRSAETDAWLAFSVRELIVEVAVQFHEDGSNFEASTVYHRLSAEIVVYATALVMALPQGRLAALQVYDHRRIRGRPPLPPAPVPLHPVPGQNRSSPFPNWYWRRLERMAEFSIDITRPDGSVVQIGDNDSGRFLKLYPAFVRISVSKAKAAYANLDGYQTLPDSGVYLLEKHLDHRHLVAAINGFFKRADFSRFAATCQFETQMVHLLAQCAVRAENMHLAIHWTQPETSPMAPGANSQIYYFPAPKVGNPGGLRQNLKRIGYPDFGLYIFKSPRLYLAIRCGPIGLGGLGPHAHNDALSIELWLDGDPLVQDPGTYLYTPLPAQRNAFRSVNAHYAPHLLGHEPGNMNKSLFALGNEAHAECLRFDDDGFLGRYVIPSGHIYRKIWINNDRVTLQDWASTAQTLVRLDANRYEYSIGYGWVTRKAAAGGVACEK